MSTSNPPTQATLEPGTQLDRYELLCVLARGGMAIVWLARLSGKHGFEKLFAIKTVLPHEADNASFREMFLDEARLASRIEHPNVVGVTDVGEYCGIPYLVMELIEGESLDKITRALHKTGSKMPVGVSLRIVADACRGLQAAHELNDASGQPLNVVHRDVSPQNIIVTTSGLSKVIDFGIAKARDRSATQTNTGTLKGKISYMPREQAIGGNVDVRTDTWALGAVLYYLLAGRPPYKEETQLGTLRLAMNAALIPPLPSSIPSAVRTLVMKALAHDAERRFQTAAELGEALEALIRKVGVVTSHGEVGSFVRSTVTDKLDARKQLVTKALAEAERRETATSEIEIPIQLMGIDETPSSSDLVVASPSTMRLLREGSGSGPQSVGAFAAASYTPRQRVLWPGIVALAVLGAVGIVLLTLVVTTKTGNVSASSISEGARSPAADRPRRLETPPTVLASSPTTTAANTPSATRGAAGSWRPTTTTPLAKANKNTNNASGSNTQSTTTPKGDDDQAGF